jgi:hypothetical protein
MDIIGNIINQIQTQTNAVIQEFRGIRGNISIQIDISPIERNIVDIVSDMMNSPQFMQDLLSMPNPNNIDVIVNSNGGDADAAYHLAKIIDGRFRGKVTYIVPRFAKSAATLLVCGGDKIMMGETSELGPLDPQIPQADGTYISAKAAKATLDLIKEQLKDKKNGLEAATILGNRINPLILGQYDSTIKIAEEYQRELLSLRMLKGKSKKEVNKIVRKFAQGYTHHSRVIGCAEAAQILGDNNVEVMDPSRREWQLVWQFYEMQRSIADLQRLASLNLQGSR